MIKTILLSSVLGLNILYPNADVCNQALDTVKQQDPKAICIPAGEDKQDQMFSKFLDMVDKLQQMENKKSKNSVDKSI